MKLHDLTRRKATEGDRRLLFEIQKRSMREHVLAAFGSFDEKKQWEMFFRVPPQEHELLVDEFAAIGFWVVYRTVDQIELARIAILPGFQGVGIGSSLIRELTCEASSNSIPVRLRVFKTNPARKLYRLLGFEEERRSKYHIHMIFQNERVKKRRSRIPRMPLR